MATNFERRTDEYEAARDWHMTHPLMRTTINRGESVVPSKLTLEDLLQETREYLAPQDIEKIQRAYDLSNRAHKGAVRRSGEAYIQHPLEVAHLLAGMRIDADGIVSALLHDVVEDTEYTLADLREQFGSDVATIVDGVTKFNALANTPSTDESDNVSLGQNGQTPVDLDVPALPPPPSLVDKRRIRTETVRKMLLAMAEDPRVVVLKVADRLHNMRTLGAMSPAQQLNTARETSEIFAPLARRLGMDLAQADLEDLSFSYLEPEKYKRLMRLVDEEVVRRLPFIDEVCRILRQEMNRAGINAQVLAWQKHLASINRKLEGVFQQQSSIQISELHDLVSFRILVDTDHECYVALGHIHALWRPKDGRIKDFIANPKLNGYQSLHTTVFCLDNRLAEIQIRTRDMQRTADYGIASYWYLKERMGKDEDAVDGESLPGSWRHSYREMVTWIEQLREWQSALPQRSADEFVEAVKGDIFQEQIFVFTPKGEVKDLPRGSTPLDMAYRIHTDIGDHCAGARIITNTDDTGRLVTRLVPLDYELKGGEIVDIVVNRTVHPTRDWLSFARTAAARNKIRRYLKAYEHEINLQMGRERLDLALRNKGLVGINEQVEQILHHLCREEPFTHTFLKQYSSLEDIYVALGREEIQVEQILKLKQLASLLHHAEMISSKQMKGNYAQNAETGDHCLQKVGETMHQVQLGQCCYPLPSDAIVGSLTPDQGLVVHRTDCQMLRRPQNNAHTSIYLNWEQVEPEYYQTPITIVAHDRSGLLRDVAAVVADAGINITTVTSMTNPSAQKAVITATLEISAEDGVLNQIDRLLRRLRQVRNVVTVERGVEH
jgi:GTP diphosphokinase / guanosine-3',5'-bis(diphosphate) 3'-diphosphatase